MLLSVFRSIPSKAVTLGNAPGIYQAGKNLVLYQRLYIRNSYVACIFKMESDLEPIGIISSLFEQETANEK